jgi:hypothetical protein
MMLRSALQRVTAIMRFGVNDLLESNPASDMAGALLSVNNPSPSTTPKDP